MSDDLGDAATRLYLEVQKARARIESLQSELATVKAERDARAKETEMLLVGCRATNKQLNIELAALRRDADETDLQKAARQCLHELRHCMTRECVKALEAALGSQPEGTQVAAGGDGKKWNWAYPLDAALPPKEGG